MNPKKWEQVKQLYQAALKIERDERPRFLAANASDDEELLREVESLLACSDEASRFLEKPAIGEVAEVIVTQRSRVGQKILQYEIIEMLGTGGMGEVYLAEDTRLRRKVALKILPASPGDDQEKVQRFEQEAYAVSALNHPNILTVYEFGEKDGVNFIASEYVKGQTLRERLIGGQISTIAEILDVALQVAAALRAAHGSGVIHRDIKPENIMVRDDELVKVLDFGLAKLNDQNLFFDPEGETLAQTAPGVVMGTITYMSPEQARGGATDARTDIWSFGVVLYEMFAGKPPFKGETASDTIAAILTHEPPPIEDLPAELPAILRKALQKNMNERYQTVSEIIVDLENFKRGSDSSSLFVALDNRAPFATGDMIDTGAENRRLSSWKLIMAGALLIALAGVGIVMWKIIAQNREQAATNLLASLRVRQLINWDAEAGEGDSGARFSPGGTMIAYSLTKNGQSNIWTKQIPDGKPNPVTDGKWDYRNPIWSPDGQRIAFVSNRDNQLAIWTMPFSGGELTPVKPIEGADIRLLSWSKNGEKIYFHESDPDGGLNVFALDLSSKQVTRLTDFDSANVTQFFSISPDEQRIAYSAGPSEQRHIFVMPIAGGPAVQVTNDAASDEYPLWLPDGRRIIYSSKREGIFQTCIAYLDERRAEQVNLGISDTLIRDVSSDGGRILFQQSREESDLWKIGTDDKTETQVTFESGLELWPDVSPDSKSIVFQAPQESKHLLEGPILIRSVDDSQPVSLAANGFSPTFSPDGRKVAFLRDADKLINLWVTGRNGADERQLTTDGVWFPGFSLMPFNRVQVKDYSWSPDGNSLIYCAKKDGVWNIWQAAADGANPPRQVTNNLDENVRFNTPISVADGKRIAYSSSAIKASPDGTRTTSLYVWNGESSVMIFSSESVFKLLGWERSGGRVVIAITEDKNIAKPVKVGLSSIAAEKDRTNLASINAAYFNDIQLSSDGRRIVFASREDGKDNIRLVSAGGGADTKLTANTDPTAYIAGIAWVPDGRAIYFSKQKQVGTISMIENFK